MIKRLGKIESAEFGMIHDMPFMFGLQLRFSFNDSGVGDGGKYTVNMSKSCEWSEIERHKAIEKVMDFVFILLNEAKVQDVSGLIGIPVEVEFENDRFKDFRILTEVL